MSEQAHTEQSTKSTRTKSEKKSEKQRSVQAVTRKVARGSKEFEVSTFDMVPALGLKNRSWKLGDFSMVDKVMHDHIYHSANDQTGQEHFFTTPSLGHFHKIVVDWDQEVIYRRKDENGKIEELKGPLVKCSPPLMWKKIPSEDGQSFRKILVKVVVVKAKKINVDTSEEYTDEQTDPTAPAVQQKDLFDTHTHEAIYLGTEVMTSEGQGQLRKKNREELEQHFEGQGGEQMLSLHSLEHAPDKLPPDQRAALLSNIKSDNVVEKSET